MTVTIKTLIPAKAMEAAQTTQYTCSVLQATIDKMTMTNTGASNATVSVHIVESGGTAESANEILKDQIIVPGQAFTATELIGHYLQQGMFISTISSVATVTMMVSGREIS